MLFEKPTQVKFADLFEEEEQGRRRILGGIAFGDFVICGECGSVLEMEDVEILEVFPWIDISDAIIGD